MNDLEVIDSRVRSNERQREGYSDIGAVWHNLWCACQLCLDSDLRFLSLGGTPLYKVEVPFFADAE